MSPMKNAAIVYCSITGNTEKVANALKEGLEDAGLHVTIRKAENAGDIDFFEYDLVCVGSPSHQWRPPQPMTDFLMKKFNHYRDEGRIQPTAPKVSGRNALIFCTYSGPHTGLNEAIPVGKYLGQFFEHLGFTVVDEWYVVGEFHGSEVNSTKGRMGDIRGRPSRQDVEKIRSDAGKMAQRLRG